MPKAESHIVRLDEFKGAVSMVYESALGYVGRWYPCCRLWRWKAAPEKLWDRKMSIEDEFAEMRRMGTVSYAEWADYAWKNELAEQKRRALIHLTEIFGEVETDHNPRHMLERSVSSAAFCMRRLLECRLVTDAFTATERSIFKISHNRQAGAP